MLPRRLSIPFLAGLAWGIGSCGQPSPDSFDWEVSFYPQVADVLERNCVVCHRDGGAAPFALTTFDQVSRKAKTIVEVTQAGIMPPWPADPDYQHFVGERRLSSADLSILKAWVQQGKKRGQGSRTLQAIVPQSGVRRPADLVLSLDTVQLHAGDPDRFFLMRIPGRLERDTWVQSMEIRAGVRNRLHHFNGHILNYTQAKPQAWGVTKQEITAGEYDQDFVRLDLLESDGSRPERVHSAVNYLPGMEGVLYPTGLGGFKLSKNFALIGNDVHYGPSDRDTLDQSTVSIWFAPSEPRRKTGEIMLGTNGLSPIVPPLFIPAGQKTSHRTEYRVMADLSLLSINPHMHLLGTSLKAYAVKPNGDTLHLISIPRWDFRWQYTYTFTHMQRVPRGSVIVCEAVFDNRAENRLNPHRPPRDVGERVEYGGASMRATDEMLQLIITYTAYQSGDEALSLQP